MLDFTKKKAALILIL